MPAPPSLPPACAQCQSSFQAPGAAPQPPAASTMTRSLDGKTRVDMGTISVITHPSAMKVVVLDHVKMEARTIAMPAGAAMPPVPGMPAMAMPAAPKPPSQAPPMQVEELGTSVIHGIPVIGKRFTMQPPAVPKPPSAPGAPGMPKPPSAPGAPQMPGAPGMPKAPAMPVVAEIWTCAKTHLPVMTKVSGSFGTQTSVCKPAQTAEPHPSAFQIPAGYKQLG